MIELPERHNSFFYYPTEVQRFGYTYVFNDRNICTDVHCTNSFLAQTALVTHNSIRIVLIESRFLLNPILFDFTIIEVHVYLMHVAHVVNRALHGIKKLQYYASF